MRWFRRWLRRRDDAGFGLVEMVVALLIAGLIFGALATTLVAAVRTSLFSRQNQQAADFMTQAIEDMRLQSFGALSVDPSGLAGGPVNVGNCAGSPCAQIEGTYANLVTPPGSTSAGVTAVSTLVGGDAPGDVHTNKTTYTLYRYITQVAGQDVGTVRRVTVFITWFSKGSTHVRSSSTVISYSQRGLQLPYFALKDTSGGVCVNPSARVVHALSIENKGAPDRWNLTMAFNSLSVDPTDATTYALYKDVDNSGTYSAGTDVPLADTNGDLKPDTGRLDPGTTFHLLLVRTTSLTTPLGSHDVTITATSVGQPTASTATQSVKVLTTVASGLCTSPSPSPSPSPTGPSPSPTVTTPPPAVDPVCSPTSPITNPAGVNAYTLTPFYLRNNGLATSAIQTQLNFTPAAPSWTSLGAYSSDVAPTVPGRVLSVPGTAVTDGNALRALTDQKTFIDWSRDFSGTRFSGNGLLHLWVANSAAGTAPSATLHVAVYATKNNGALDQELGYTDVPVSSTCTGFQEIGIPLALTAYNANGSSKTLHVRISSTAGVRFGYDTTVMPAMLVVNVR